MRASLLSFVTDYLDEGVGAVLDNVEGRAGIDGVTIAALYHDARDVFPHNPVRRIYFHEPGAVFFRPDARRYAGHAIQPLESRLLAGRDVLGDIVDTAARRGMTVDGWVVTTHADRGRELEEFAPRNAFGDPYLTNLCPANPNVRVYVCALLADTAARGVSSILAEGLHFAPFDHGFHHERAFIALPPRARFLLGLCFCDHCLAAAAQRSVDARALRDAVRADLDQTLSAGEASLGETIGREEISGLYGGELGGYLDARADTVRSFGAEAVAAVEDVGTGARLLFVDPGGAVKGYTGGRPTGEPAAAGSWQLGIDLEEAAGLYHGIHALAYAADPARVELELAGYRSATGEAPLGCVLRPTVPDCESAANLAEKVRAAKSAGAARLDFYHYGLARLSALDWIREALAETPGPA